MELLLAIALLAVAVWAVLFAVRVTVAVLKKVWPFLLGLAILMGFLIWEAGFFWILVSGGAAIWWIRSLAKKTTLSDGKVSSAAGGHSGYVPTSASHVATHYPPPPAPQSSMFERPTGAVGPLYFDGQRIDYDIFGKATHIGGRAVEYDPFGNPVRVGSQDVQSLFGQPTHIGNIPIQPLLGVGGTPLFGDDFRGLPPNDFT